MPIHQKKTGVEGIVAQQIEEWAIKFQAHYDEKISVINQEHKETLAIVNHLGKYVNNLENKISNISSNLKNLRDEHGQAAFPALSNDFHSPTKNNTEDVASRLGMLEKFCGYDPEREAYAALGMGTGDLMRPEQKLSTRLEKVEGAIAKLDRNVRHVETEVNIITQEKSNNQNFNEAKGNGMFFPEKPRPKSMQGTRPHHTRDRDSTPGHHGRPSPEAAHSNGYATPHPPPHTGTFGYRSAPSQKSRNVSSGRPTSAPNASAGANRGQMMNLLEEVRNQIGEVDDKNNMQNTFLMNDVMANINAQDERTDRKLRAVETKLKQYIREVDDNAKTSVNDLEQSVFSKVKHIEAVVEHIQLQRPESFLHEGNSVDLRDSAEKRHHQQQEIDRMLNERDGEYREQQQSFHKKEIELQKELQRKEEELRHMSTMNAEAQEAYNRMKGAAARLEEENNKIKEEHAKHIAHLEQEFVQRHALVDERTELYKAETQRLRDVHHEMQQQVNAEISQRTERLEEEKARLEEKLTEEMTQHNRQVEKDRMIKDTLQSEIEMFKKSCNQAHHDKEQIAAKLKAAEAKYADLEVRLKSSPALAKSSPKEKATPSSSRKPLNVRVPTNPFDKEEDVAASEEEDDFNFETPVNKSKPLERGQSKKRVDTPIPQPRGGDFDPQAHNEKFVLSPDTGLKKQHSKDLKKQHSKELRKQQSKELKKQQSRDLQKQSSRELRKQNSTSSSTSRSASKERPVHEAAGDVDDTKLQEMVQNNLTQNDIDDIIVLEELIKEKEAELEAVSASKSKAKKKIKAWLNEFERTYDRQPNQSEKEGMSELYLNHQKLSDLRQDHEDTLEKMKATLNQTVNKVIA